MKKVMKLLSAILAIALILGTLPLGLGGMAYAEEYNVGPIYTTPSLGLPETVEIDGAATEVNWNLSIDEYEVYEDATVTGTINNGADTVTAAVSVYPDNMRYFVDCNDSDDSVFEGVKSVSSGLINAVGDQTTVTDGWGLASESAAYGKPSDNTITVGDKYKTGWYATAGNSIEYQFTLPAGSYSLTAGFYEFWNGNRPRYMSVTVTDAEDVPLGETATAYLDTSATAELEVSQVKTSVDFELTEEQLITVTIGKAESDQDPVLSWIGIAENVATEPETPTITTQEGITASVSSANEGETVTLSGDFAKNSIFVTDQSGVNANVTYNEDGTASFTMPASSVNVAGLVNTNEVEYVVPESIERVNGGEQTDNRNYFIGTDRALGMTFNIPEGKYIGAKLHFIRQNTAPGQTTNVYDQSENGFSYVNGEGYIAQYNGNSQTELAFSEIPDSGEYKILMAYDASVSSSASGNDYYVVGANSGGTESANQLPKNVDQLPYLELTKGESWDVVADQFTGTLPDYNIVWYKYSGDSAGGSYDYNDGVLTIRSNEGLDLDSDSNPSNVVCYGVSAVIKNIKPNTE